jgi:hypothetical protein
MWFLVRSAQRRQFSKEATKGTKSTKEKTGFCAFCASLWLTILSALWRVVHSAEFVHSSII